jgi:regulator of sirC expression with transglutaminase-like and TPR domain
MRPSATENLIEALIHLLQEEDDRLEIVRQKLIEIGAPARPLLQKTAAQGAPLISERAAQILESIRLEEMDREWQAYVRKEPCPLEEGVFLLARFGDSHLDTEHYHQKLDQMAEALRERVGSRRLPEEVIEILNRYLFHELKFSGNKLQYYLPENSYIHNLLDLKKGIPISLSVLILLLAERLHLPVYGVGMPGHFLVKWAEGGREIYIDPFNLGQILSRDEIATYLSEGGMTWKDEYLETVSSRQMIARMIRNLIHIYKQEGEVEKGVWLERFYEWVRLSF